MASSGRFSAKSDETLIGELLVPGRTLKSAAEAAGFSEREARRRAADPDFRRKLDEARRELVSLVAAQLAADADKARATLVALLEESEPAAVRRNAAKDILGSVNELGGARDVDGRLDEVERLLGELLASKVRAA